jgi:hypothetical protein
MGSVVDRSIGKLLLALAIVVRDILKTDRAFREYNVVMGPVGC